MWEAQSRRKKTLSRHKLKSSMLRTVKFRQSSFRYSEKNKPSHIKFQQNKLSNNLLSSSPRSVSAPHSPGSATGRAYSQFPAGSIFFFFFPFLFGTHKHQRPMSKMNNPKRPVLLESSYWCKQRCSLMYLSLWCSSSNFAGFSPKSYRLCLASECTFCVVSGFGNQPSM